MTNTEETLTEVAVEEEVQALNTQTSGRPTRQTADKADLALSEFHERAISEVCIGPTSQMKINSNKKTTKSHDITISPLSF